ncbi:MAG: NAD-dependent epimerase/dehydratase family protein [Candidatus Aenigmatarchaeota archaeon]|nr:MAG: NAD-dependent epimerase/dehydratase family protein [Candidatus Aenigmarchaeota archaeon]
MLLVTGATGFIGKEVVGRLIRKGYKIRALCIDTDDAKNLPKGVDAVIGDITHHQSLISATEGIDTVIHLAGIISYSKSIEELFRINAIGTKNLLRHCGKVKKFILSSSVSVYGEIKGEADENYPPSPGNHYGESKLKAEQFVRESGLNHVILRIAPIYGVASPVWKRNLRLLEKGFPIPSTDSMTHVVHVSDVAEAFVRAVEKGSGTYNIADSSPIRFTDFAEKLVTLLGKKPRKLPHFMVRGIAAVMGMGNYLRVLTINRHYVIRKAEKELGYRPKADVQKELKRMVDWYRGLS